MPEQLPTGLELEYTALRAEIVQRIGLRQQLLAITLTLAGVIVGFGIENGTIALVYPPLAVFLALAWTQNDGRVRDAASYIRDELEPRMWDQPDQGWERTVHRSKQDFNRNWRRTVVAHFGLFLGTQLLALLVALTQFDESALDVGLVLVSLGSVVAVVSIMLRAQGRKHASLTGAR